MSNKRARWHLLGIWVIVLSGCSLFETRPSLPRGYLIPYSKPHSTPISNRVYLVADNQLHNLYGGPVQIFRTGAADKVVQTAIRPIQLDFYGQDLLGWLVEKGLDPIVHVGDACDFSCTGEFEQFREIMQKAKMGWVMAPGNHDGFFFGNEHRAPTDGDWRSACLNAGKPMTKDEFVRLYLAALVMQGQTGDSQEPGKPGYEGLARFLGLADVGRWDLARLGDSIPVRGNWEHRASQPGGQPFLRAVSWEIDKDRPWRSYVVQELDLCIDPTVLPDPEKASGVAVRAILLDTAQYESKPLLFPVSRNAGVAGDLGGDQASIVKAWIQASENEDMVWILIGHHPFDRLTEKAKEAVDDLRRHARALLYVSAHTHTGEFIVHGEEAAPDNWLELNIGSILDWSQEFRTLQVSVTGEGEGRFMIRSPRATMQGWLEEIEGIPVKEREVEWGAKPGDPDYYLSHENRKDLDAHETEIHLKNALLATFGRLIRFNPTKEGIPGTPWPPCCGTDEAMLARIDRTMKADVLDEKIEFLIQLDHFEKERPLKDVVMHRRYRLSQAIWASKYDSVHARKPLEDGWFVVFPQPADK